MASNYMGSSNRPKMSRADRAKQFMPFAALKGLPEALAKQEKQIVEKSILSPEGLDELDRKFKEIAVGQIITVVFYEKCEYIKKTGMVSKIDVSSRCLKVVDKKICFEDIYEIQTCDF